MSDPRKETCAKVLAFIVAFYAEWGYMPHQGEIGQGVGITAQGVRRHIKTLVEEKKISVVRHKMRSITIL